MQPPEAVSNLALMMSQTSPDWTISTITQSYLANHKNAEKQGWPISAVLET